MADLEKKEEKSRQWKPYSCSELSAFCLQVSLLLEAAVPLDEGFSIMAEDAADVCAVCKGNAYFFKSV